MISAWFDRRRGLALATMMAGVGAGAIGIPPLTTWLIAAYGLRGAYLLLGASIFVLGLVPSGAVAARDAAAFGRAMRSRLPAVAGDAGLRSRAYAGFLASADRLLPVLCQRQRLRRASDTVADRSRDRR